VHAVLIPRIKTICNDFFLVFKVNSWPSYTLSNISEYLGTSKNRKITKKASKKCAPKDLFTFASDDFIPGNVVNIRLLTDDRSEHADVGHLGFLLMTNSKRNDFLR